MPIRKITEVDTFTQEETELLASAFESTLLELNLDRSDPLARSIAISGMVLLATSLGVLRCIIFSDRESVVGHKQIGSV